MLKMIKINKKGAYDFAKDAQKFIFYAIILVIFFLIFYYGIINYVDREVEIKDLQHNILIQRLFYDKNCFSFVDDERAYPGIIDLSKFNENRLSKCLAYQQGKGQGFVLNLTDFNNNQLGYAGVNKEITLRMPECGVEDKQFECFFDKRYVLVWDEDKFEKALLNIEVITL